MSPRDGVEAAAPLTGTPSAFAVGTGRCGTHLLFRLLADEPGVLSVHEADPVNETFHRYCQWNDLAVDPHGFLQIKRAEIARAGQEGRLYFEASAYVSFSIRTLYQAFGSRFILMTRDPVATVNSLWVKGWYATTYEKSDVDLPVGYHSIGPVHHFLGRIVPRGPEFDRWQRLTRIGKLAWYWNVTHLRILDQFRKLPETAIRVQRVEDLSFESYGPLAEALGIAPTLSRGRFHAICSEVPGAGREHKHLASWTRTEREELAREVAPAAELLGYADVAAGVMR